MDVVYKRWITNCPYEEAFERLMKYSAIDPDGFYSIGRPHETVSICRQTSFYYDLSSSFQGITTKGCTVEDLERMDYCGIYECFPPTSY